MRKAPTTKHVLVYADDDEDDLLLVKDALSQYASTLDLYLLHSGFEAYRFLLSLEKKQEKPCLIILDMNMPAMGGKELLLILRSIPFFDDVPIILFTTSSMQHDYHFALIHNAGFITKPMTFQQMELIAEQFLEHCSEAVRENIRGSNAGRL